MVIRIPYDAVEPTNYLGRIGGNVEALINVLHYGTRATPPIQSGPVLGILAPCIQVTTGDTLTKLSCSTSSAAFTKLQSRLLGQHLKPSPPSFLYD